MNKREILSFVPSLVFGLSLLGGCATAPGDTVACPVCDGISELLVGARCVPIAEVAVCGPDGHAHGDACHCFSGQEPTTIGGAAYCLQQGCGGAGEEEDLDAWACEEVGQAPEQATAVVAFADFAAVHLEDARVTEVILPAGQESYVHCAAPRAGHLRLDLAAAGVLLAALDAAGRPLELEGGAANPDCPAGLPATYEVHLPAGEDYPHPVVLRFAAGEGGPVRIVVRATAAK